MFQNFRLRFALETLHNFLENGFLHYFPHIRIMWYFHISESFRYSTSVVERISLAFHYSAREDH